jgi:transcriptional regulator with XRE-family HTH domain
MTTPAEPEENLNKEVANRLAMFRKEHIDKSQNKAAKILGMAQSTLSEMESGKSEIKYTLMEKFMKEYGLNLEWLSTGKGKMIAKAETKTNLITDINLINQELHALRKTVELFEMNQRILTNLVKRLEKKIAAK